MVVNIIVNYCCTQKMLRETEETIVFCHIFIIGSISIGGGLGPPLATPMPHGARPE